MQGNVEFSFPMVLTGRVYDLPWAVIQEQITETLNKLDKDKSGVQMMEFVRFREHALTVLVFITFHPEICLLIDCADMGMADNFEFHSTDEIIAWLKVKKNMRRFNKAMKAAIEQLR